MLANGIFDPVKVTRLALESAVSIASTVLTAEAGTEKKTEKRKGGGLMIDRDSCWMNYVRTYPLTVPEENVQNEIEYFKAQARHCLRYDTLTGGAPHPFAELEIAEREEEIHEAAWLEAKSDMVIKELLKNHPVSVTENELRQEAEAICKRQKYHDGTCPPLFRRRLFRADAGSPNTKDHRSGLRRDFCRGI